MEVEVVQAHSVRNPDHLVGGIPQRAVDMDDGKNLSSELFGRCCAGKGSVVVVSDNPQPVFSGRARGGLGGRGGGPGEEQEGESPADAVHKRQSTTEN
jgi:hypothetical protein